MLARWAPRWNGGTFGATRARAAQAPVAAMVAMVALAACGDGRSGDAGGGATRDPARPAAMQAPAPTAITATDDGGHAVRLARPAHRIVSLIPSATETLVALGVAERIVGRTDYDVAPAVADRPSVGGGLDPSVEAIVALRPDLVVTWAHDARQQTRTKLAALGIPTFSLATEDTTDAYRGMTRLGHLVGRDAAADALVGGVRAELEAVRRSVAGRERPSVLFVVGEDPPMTTGGGTFVAQLIAVAGGRATFGDVAQRWPTVAMEEIVRRDPDVIVLPVGAGREGRADRLRELAGWRALRAVRTGRVHTASADLLSRPGPHLGAAARALRSTIHPALGGVDGAGTTPGAGVGAPRGALATPAGARP